MTDDPPPPPGAGASRQALLAMWQENATAWADTVRSGSIESRRLCTDAAILDAVRSCSPRAVLDVGCGEGWLSHRLAAQGIRVLGVDPVDTLVRAAQAGAPGAFRRVGTRELATHDGLDGFDVWACNFALFHPQDAVELVHAAGRRLAPGGTLVIQTLPAQATAMGADATDGWQPGSWSGCGPAFGRPVPWYYRTAASWQALLRDAAFTSVDIREPVHPATGRAASRVIVARREV